MAWFKVDDGFWSHPKTLRLTPDAIALWVRAGAWSCQQLTDGLIEHHVLAMFGSNSSVAAELVDAGYWEEDPAGFVFHDWADYQEASGVVKARRTAARERMKAVRANKTRTKPERASEQAANVRDVFAKSSLNPDPTRPDPTRPINTPSKEGVGAPTPTPYCSRHPEGTDKACIGCRQARKKYLELEAETTPTHTTRTHIHRWMPDGTCGGGGNCMEVRE